MVLSLISAIFLDIVLSSKEFVFSLGATADFLTVIVFFFFSVVSKPKSRTTSFFAPEPESVRLVEVPVEFPLVL